MNDMRLRSQLWLLVAATLAPMAAFAVYAAQQLIDDERAALERDAIGRARAAMSAVDAHLRGSIVSLQTLAASKHLESGDIAAFHAESQRVLRTQPAWANIGLSSADRRLLSNAVYALGKPEPLPAVDEPSYERALRSGKAAVGDVAAGTAVRSPTVRVRLPVSYGEEVRYVLSAPLNLKPLSDLLQAQRLPEEGAIGLVDRERRMIVRVPPVAANLPASDGLREALDRAPEGWFHGRTREGRQTYTAYVTSELSGWSLGIAIPAATVEAGERRTFNLLALGCVLAVAIGVMLAGLIAGREPR
jgi:hypothetical protein